MDEFTSSKSSLKKPWMGFFNMLLAAQEPRGSQMFIRALLSNPVYVLGQVSRPAPGGEVTREPFDMRALYHVDGRIVLTTFSSWRNAEAFLVQCGILDVRRFTLALGNDFILNTFQASGRVFLKPRTEYERELWPEKTADAPGPAPADSLFLLCGNPGMIDTMMEVLQREGFKKHLRKDSGQIHVEKYW